MSTNEYSALYHRLCLALDNLYHAKVELEKAKRPDANNAELHAYLLTITELHEKIEDLALELLELQALKPPY